MNRPLATLALGLALTGTAFAQTLSYDYLEAGLALYPSFNSQDLVGIDLRASAELEELASLPNLFALGGLKYLSGKRNFTAFHAGAAYRFEIEADTHAWGGITLEHQGVNRGGPSDTAFGLRGGLRHQLNRDLEVGGSLRLVTGDLDYVGLTGTLRYAWQDRLSWFGEADLYDGNLGLIGGVNYAF